jgi:hypothetical protein
VSENKVLDGFGRYAGPATLILASLAGGAKHGYALTKATTLQAQLDAQRRVADVGLRRLAQGWGPA